MLCKIMYVPNLVIFWFVFCTGVPGNLVILAAYYCKTPKKSTDVLILIQAFVDLIGCINPLGEMIGVIAVCWISLIVSGITSLGSLLLTFIIALDRYISVCRPFGRQLSIRAVFLISSACFAITLVINLTYFKYLSYSLHTPSGSKSPECLLSGVQSSPLQFFTSAIKIISFAIAAVVSLYSYTNIYIRIHLQAKVRAEMDEANQARPVAANRNDPNRPCVEGPGPQSERAQDLNNEQDQSQPQLHRGDENIPAPATCSDTIHPLGSSAGNGQGQENPPVSSDAPGASHGQARNIFVTASSAAVGTGIQPRTAQPQPAKRRVFGNKTTTMLLVTTIFMLLSWLPFIIINCLTIEIYFRVLIKYVGLKVLNLLFFIRRFNHMVNFFIYFVVNPVFRQNVKTAFRRLKHTLKL